MTERITEKIPPDYAFGDYVLLEHVGSGSFGMVCTARATGSGADGDLVAIKILRPVNTRSDDVDTVVRFETEASQLQQQGNHQNIARFLKKDKVDSSTVSNDLLNRMDCRVSGVGKKHSIDDCDEKPEGSTFPTGDIQYMVGEYYPDGNLEEWIEEEYVRERLTLVDKLDICIGIATGVRWIQGSPPDPALVHQDLKPQNIYMKDRIPKIGDFGISLEEGCVSGFATREWADPKQANGEKADFRFDQYSFGGIVFWVFTYEKPFLKNTEGKFIKREDWDQLYLDKDVPDEVAAVIRKCSEPQLDKRYKNFEAVINDLMEARRILNIEPESVEPESVEPESVEPESVDPESVDPESVEPESVDPESVEPESVDPESADPESVEPESGIKTLRRLAHIEPVYLGIFFLVLAASLVLVDILEGSTGSRWVDWAQWPILGLALIFGGLALYISRRKSFQTIGVMILITGLAFGLWIGWSGSEAIQSNIQTPIQPSMQLKVIEDQFATGEYGRIQVVVENPSDNTSLLYSDVLMTTTPAMNVYAEEFICSGDAVGACYGEITVLPGQQEIMVIDLHSPVPGSFVFHFTGWWVFDGDLENRTSILLRHPIVIEPVPTSNDSTYLELDSISGYPGDLIEVLGVGFPPDQLVDMMTIGSITVMPAEPLQISGDGSLRFTMTVPDIGAGTKTLFIGSHETFATEEFRVLDDVSVRVASTVTVPDPTRELSSTPVPTLPKTTPTKLEAFLILEDIYSYSGDEFVIKGKGFPIGRNLDEITLGGISILPAIAVKVKQDGTFTATVSIPTLNSGAKNLYVQAGFASAVEQVWLLAPSLTLPRIYGYPGDEIEINGSMFTPGETLAEMTMGGISVLLGPPIVVDRSGTFAVSVVIPNLGTGAHELYLHSRDDVNRWSATVYVLENSGMGTPSAN